MKVTPLNCNVLIKPDVVEDKVGSIFLPDNVRESQKFQQTVATVVAIADDAFMDINTGAPSPAAPGVGDRVYFGKYAAKEIDKKENVWIVKDVDITAVVNADG